MTEMYI